MRKCIALIALVMCLIPALGFAADQHIVKIKEIEINDGALNVLGERSDGQDIPLRYDGLEVNRVLSLILAAKANEWELVFVNHTVTDAYLCKIVKLL